MTTTVNPTLEIGERVFKNLLWDSLLQAKLAALFAGAPYLAVWPIRQVVTEIATRAADELFDGFKTFIDVQAVVFLNASHKRDFDKCAVTLKIIALKKGIESPDFKKAREDAKAALAKYSAYNA